MFRKSHPAFFVYIHIFFYLLSTTYVYLKVFFYRAEINFSLFSGIFCEFFAAFAGIGIN